MPAFLGEVVCMSFPVLAHKGWTSAKFLWNDCESWRDITAIMISTRDEEIRKQGSSEVNRRDAF